MAKEKQEALIIPSLTEKSLASVFSGRRKMAEILEQIKARVGELSLDIDSSTPEGRKELAVIATKINKSKEAIDSYGKGLVAEQKKKLKVVDDQRKEARDFLDAMREKVRKPIVEYELEASRLQTEALDREQRLADWDAAIIEDKLFEAQKSAREANIRAIAAESAVKIVAQTMAEHPIKQPLVDAVQKLSTEENNRVDHELQVNVETVKFFTDHGIEERKANELVFLIIIGVAKHLKINY